jgi:uncharacterized protein YbjT (DUF2867 family)
MRIFLTGAGGFVGRHISAALLAAGHDVRAMVRPGKESGAGMGTEVVCGDMARDTTIDAWLPRLAGIDVVVNCAGILREQGRSTFLAVHEQAPQALYQASVQAGVRKIVQISALGEAQGNEFIASKYRGDDFLLTLPIASVVLRPSVIYSVNGSYGGTSLLRALAALPGLLLLPGRGEQQIQPLAADDLALLVLAAINSPAGDGRMLYAGGPQVISLRQYLHEWRQWLGAGRALEIAMPLPLVRLAVRVGERLAPGPFNRTIMGMLEQGNCLRTGQQNAADLYGVEVLSLATALSRRASYVQDRWHARLYFLKPVTVALVGVVWITSALAGFLASPPVIAHFAAGLGFSPSLAQLADGFGSVVDGVLGLALLCSFHQRAVLWLMLLSVLVYTAVFSVFMPELWLDPLGGLLKNLLVLPALAFLLMTEDAS